MIEETEHKIKMSGHVLITDKMTDEILVDQTNAINFESMSWALAMSLSNWTVGGIALGPIESMVFGNGGTSVNGVGVVTYLDKNVTGLNASLYNQTYSKIIDPNNPQNENPNDNNVTPVHVSGNLFSDVVCVCTLEFGEPAGQLALDNATSMQNTYTFDELALKNYNGNLLTYVNFHPVQKSANRIFQIQYSIRISLV